MIGNEIDSTNPTLIGDYVIIERIAQSKTKIAGEIVHSISSAHQEHLKSLSMWPEGFRDSSSSDGCWLTKMTYHTNNNDGIFVNTNHRYSILLSSENEEQEDVIIGHDETDEEREIREEKER